MNVFSRYSPTIQRYIYREGWTALRAVQAAAGEAIFGSEENVLLSASTASGKTEAAFFPIITLLQEQPPASVGCLYIAPLKALINDQFERLGDICAESGIKVWHWHGDVSQSQKKQLLRRPQGILQITPESLESMLMRRHSELRHLFGDLRFIVIDEIHSFLRGDRGGQTLCLIERLGRLAGVNPRRIGLSATIGDPRLVGKILAAGTHRGTLIPRLKAPGAKWRISMAHFFAADISKPVPPTSVVPMRSGGVVGAVETFGGQAEPIGPEQPAVAPRAAAQGPQAETPAQALRRVADPSMLYLLNGSRGHKCLIFSNSREECEVVCATLRLYCKALHEPDRFLIHHGNLSVAYRQGAEERIKEDEANISVCTTSTLELGIDIGRLERAFQIDAPFTVSAFLQRMGRTGRRGAPSEMWFVIREEPVEARALLPARIPWKLLQAIALVQLYVDEKWVEPPRSGRLPYSLLYHQTMSTLASEGEMTPAMLAARVLTLSPFAGVTADDYKLLLRHLLSNDEIATTERGGLIVGIAGERVVSNFKFYAVFQENEEYSVRCESQEIGTICKPPPVGEKIAIAGRVWTVEEIDPRRHVVYCHPVGGIVPAYFGDEPGDIHTHILERMHRVLSRPEDYPYLQPSARERLVQARHAAARAGMDRRWLLPLGGGMFCLFPWLGSYAFLALERFLRIRCAAALGLKSFDSQRPYYMQFSMAVSPARFFEVLAAEVQRPLDPMELLYPREQPVFDKYDDHLPPELRRKGFACGVLDIDGMRRRVQQMCAPTSLPVEP